jgi:hypothetical protein
LLNVGRRPLFPPRVKEAAVAPAAKRRRQRVAVVV